MPLASHACSPRMHLSLALQKEKLVRVALMALKNLIAVRSCGAGRLILPACSDH